MSEDKTVYCREEEQRKLLMALHSKQAEFVAVYGRRRIGKTFLVRHTCKQSNVPYYEFLGSENWDEPQAKLISEVERFKREVIDVAFPEIKTEIKKWLVEYCDTEDSGRPENWSKVIDLLLFCLKTVRARNPDKTLVIFFDEVPWMCKGPSDFKSSLDRLVNSDDFQSSKLKVIVCGSATSWMLKNIVSNTSTSYKRLTLKPAMHLLPFTLRQTKEYIEKKRNAAMSRLEVIKLYMALGGVADYLDDIDEGANSWADEIQRIIFKNEGIEQEFSDLYEALFGEDHKDYEKIVRNLGTATKELSREDLFVGTRLKKATKKEQDQVINDLEKSSIVKKYDSVDKGTVYRLIDYFSVFYLKWVEGAPSGIKWGENYWTNPARSKDFESWKGFAFESICFSHIRDLEEPLKLVDKSYNMQSWSVRANKDEDIEGAQVDMLIKSESTTPAKFFVLEMKFYEENLYDLTKDRMKAINRKVDSLSKVLCVDKEIILTGIVAAKGVDNVSKNEGRYINYNISAEKVFF